jgi:hypothetical protein
MLFNSITCSLCLSLAVLSKFVQIEASTTPNEQFFFNNMSLVVAWTVENTADARTSFDGMYAEVGSTPELLEMRIMQEFEDPTKNTGPRNESTITAWLKWTSVNDYLNRGSKFMDSSLSYIRTDMSGILNDFNGCHYCKRNEKIVVNANPITSRISNSQSAAKYPIVSTYGIKLDVETEEEDGTLDYLLTNPVGHLNTTNINFNFDLADFWAMYNSPSAFDTHVANVGKSLQVGPLSPLDDIGHEETMWYYTLNYTSGCYKCKFDHKDPFNPGVPDVVDTGSNDDYLDLNPGAFYFIVIGMPILYTVLFFAAIKWFVLPRGGEDKSANYGKNSHPTMNPVQSQL